MRKLFFLLLLTALLSGCATIHARQEMKHGDRLFGEGNYKKAVIYYQRAIDINPDNIKIKIRLSDAKNRLATRLFEKGEKEFDNDNLNSAIDYYKAALKFDLLEGKVEQALEKTARKRRVLANLSLAQKQMDAMRWRLAKSEVDKALLFEPSNSEALKLAEIIDGQLEISRKRETAELFLDSTEPVTLRFNKTKLKEVISVLAKISKLNIVLDSDVKDRNITVFIKDAPFKEALSLLLASNKLAMKRISRNTILLMPKNKQKQADYTDLMVRTFYLNYMPVKEAVNLLRTMLDTRKVFVNSANNSIVIRETPEKILLAEKIIEANDMEPAEVMIELEILEVNETDSDKFGWEFTQNFASFKFDLPDGFNLNSFRGRDDSSIALSIPGVMVDFLKQASNAKVLAHPRLRIKNGKKARITVGDKVPIELSSSSSQSTTSSSTGGVTTSTSIEFKPVGITVEVTPAIHFNNDMTLDLSIEITSLGDRVELSSGSQFRFGERKVNTVLSVVSGETIVIGGLIREESRESESNLPIVGNIPFLRWLFQNSNNSKTKTDILITITPHLLKSLEMPPVSVQEFWSGTERTFALEPLFKRTGRFKVGNGQPTLISDEAKAATPVSGNAVNHQPARAGSISLDSGSSSPVVDEVVVEEKSSVRQVEHGAAITLSVPEKVYKAGDTITVSVEFEGAVKVSDLFASIKFDPASLAFIEAEEGSLLAGDKWPTAFISSGNPDSGIVNIRTYRIRDNNGIMLSGGSGRFFTLRFKAKSDGSSLVTFERVDLFGPSRNLLDVELNNGMVPVE